MFETDIPLTIPVILAAAQIALDIVLILIVLFLLKRISSFDPKKFTQLITTLKESEELCRRLNATVAENAEIAGNIQRIISEAKESKGATERKQAPKGTKSRREEILSMWAKGMSVEDIADATGLGKGEVEVITALAGARGKRDR